MDVLAKSPRHSGESLETRCVARPRNRQVRQNRDSDKGILETGLSAMYSSLRRKKKHTTSYTEGRSVNPGVTGKVCEAEPSFSNSILLCSFRGHLSVVYSKSSLALTDFVVLRGPAPRTP